MRKMLRNLAVLMMGEEAFKCSSCGYSFPHHADSCQYHPNNLR